MILRAWRPPIACHRSQAIDPRAQFGPNPRCPARGRTARDNIQVHSYAERRVRCTICRKTFAASTGAPFYRPHKDPALFVRVVTLLAYGCPTRAVVAAFGLDERTVGARQDKAGGHAQGVHHHFLGTSPLDLRHVQADAIYGKTAGGRRGLAMAVAVPCRLGRGGVVSPVGDPRLPTGWPPGGESSERTGLVQLLMKAVHLPYLISSLSFTLIVCQDAWVS